MKDNLALPSCIQATRIGGRWESDYDFQGNLLPVTWQCDCGRRLTLARYDDEFVYYVPVSEAAKKEFLAAHTSCTAKCWKCNVAPVGEYGQWCDSCSDNCS